MDMTELDIYKAGENKELSEDVRFACKTKVGFRANLAQKIALIRVDYIYRVLRKYFVGK